MCQAMAMVSFSVFDLNNAYGTGLAHWVGLWLLMLSAPLLFSLRIRPARKVPARKRHRPWN